MQLLVNKLQMHYQIPYSQSFLPILCQEIFCTPQKSETDEFYVKDYRYLLAHSL